MGAPFDFRNYYRGRTILITGGAGCIGSNLARALAEVGAERIIILDDLSSAYSWNVPSLPKLSLWRATFWMRRWSIA